MGSCVSTELERERVRRYFDIVKGKLPILNTEDEGKLATFDSDTYRIIKKKDSDGITRSYLESIKNDGIDAWTFTWIIKVNCR